MSNRALLAAALVVALLATAAFATEGIFNPSGGGIGSLEGVTNSKGAATAQTGSALLVDNASPALLIDNTNPACLAGGC